MEYNKWIDWEKFPVPEDVKGIFIKFDDEKIFTGSKRDRKGHKIIGWKFMERRNGERSIQCEKE